MWPRICVPLKGFCWCPWWDGHKLLWTHTSLLLYLVWSMCNLQLTWQVQVTLRLTVNQPVSLGVKPLLGLMTRLSLWVWPLQYVIMWRNLWWKGDLSFVICLCLCDVYAYVHFTQYIHIQYLQFTMYNMYMASVSLGSVQQIMPYLT
jgi:hypothetical protein